MPSLPPRLKTAIKASRHFAHTKHMTGVKANIASAGNIVRHSAAKQVDEIGPATAAAVEKILALP
jgi:hypothetical protein